MTFKNIVSPLGSSLIQKMTLQHAAKKFLTDEISRSQQAAREEEQRNVTIQNLVVQNVHNAKSKSREDSLLPAKKEQDLT
jgi:hypothetical protein